MKAIIALGVAAVALGACTFRSTTVRPAEAPPPATVVYPAPPPSVVYQSPPTVVYQQQPTTAYGGRTYNVAVNYTGPNGFELATQKADAYCDEHYGNSRVRLVSDDRIAGRATFACEQL